MGWTDLSAAFGYGTKLTSTQQGQLRDNATHVYEMLTPSTEGQMLIGQTDNDIPAMKTLSGGITIDKDGLVPLIGQAQLKTSTGSVSTTLTAGEYLTLPGGEYGFYPQLKNIDASYWALWSDVDLCASKVQGVTYTTKIGLKTSNIFNAAYAQQRYVTASGEVFWIFIRRHKDTKEIISMYQAPDHPCFGNGGKPLIVTHPFSDVDYDKQEIIVINPELSEVIKMNKSCIVQDESKPDRDLLQIILEDYKIDEHSKPSWPDIAVTVGLPRDCDIKPGELIKPIKKVIPHAEHLILKSMLKL